MYDVYIMPATIPPHAALRTRLKDSAKDAVSLDTRLELLIASRPWRPSGNFHGKIDFSQPPWYAPVAHSHLDLHALSRKLEKEFRGELGLPCRVRGGSTGNTRKALEALCKLAESVDDFLVRAGMKELDKWSRRASVALEETETPKRLPRSPGHPEPKCPFCEHHTLRAKPLSGEIYCIDMTCRDDNNQRPKAHMEYSGIANDWVMVWQDGIPGVPV
jgi:hypothetical protein